MIPKPIKRYYLKLILNKGSKMKKLYLIIFTFSTLLISQINPTNPLFQNLLAMLLFLMAKFTIIKNLEKYYKTENFIQILTQKKLFTFMKNMEINL